MARGIDLVDFEKVNSLEGVFIANRLSAHMKGKMGLSKRTEVNEDTESMIQNRLDKMRR